MVAIPVVETASVPIVGTRKRFPVHRIYCVGQNYADHAREMGSDPDRQEPFFFSKPADAVVTSRRTLVFPRATANLHYEVELVVALAKGGSDVSKEQAADLIFGYTIGLDMTRRDLQAEAKKNGRPWDMAKGFDESAPLGALVPGLPPLAGRIALTVNEEERQSGDLNQMIWSVTEIIACLSKLVVLRPGDLIFTGTPAGVGPVQPGDRLHGAIDGCPALDIFYAAASDGDVSPFFAALDDPGRGFVRGGSFFRGNFF